MEIRVVGVIGAGLMGVGVAQNLAQTGHDVVLLDVSDQILDRARQAIAQNVRFQRFFQKGEKTNGDTETLERITFSTDLAALKEVEFVIENVTEKWEVKKEVYTAIDALCPPHIVFGANTSVIEITRLASLTSRASKVIGLHFMNPVPLKPMVEVICGEYTSEETLEKAKGLLARMGKQSLIVKDSPGFVSNRVLMLMINEAIFVVHEKLATVEEVDKLFTSCFGHKMGPLATADLIGLDTVLFSLNELSASLDESKYLPCPLLKQMVEAGLYGRKSGQGFFPY